MVIEFRYCDFTHTHFAHNRNLKSDKCQSMYNRDLEFQYLKVVIQRMKFLQLHRQENLQM